MRSCRSWPFLNTVTRTLILTFGMRTACCDTPAARPIPATFAVMKAPKVGVFV